MPIVDANSTVDANNTAVPPTVHVHAGSLSPKHGLRHHKLTAIHNPQLSSLLSAESAESAEVVPVAPAVVVPVAPAVVDTAAPAADPVAPAADPAAVPAVADPAADSVSDATHESQSAEGPRILFKRDVLAAPAATVADNPATQTGPILLVPVCPGRVRFF